MVVNWLVIPENKFRPLLVMLYGSEPAVCESLNAAITMTVIISVTVAIPRLTIIAIYCATPFLNFILSYHPPFRAEIILWKRIFKPSFKKGYL